jgi:hypothetical protein
VCLRYALPFLWLSCIVAKVTLDGDSMLSAYIVNQLLEGNAGVSAEGGDVELLDKSIIAEHTRTLRMTADVR